MRITRIDIQSAKGDATLTLDCHVGRPQIRVSGWAGATPRQPFSDWAFADADGIVGLARPLQLRLDGYGGSAGDVADYHRLLEQMA